MIDSAIFTLLIIKNGIIPFYIVINYIFRGVLSPLYSFSMSYISIHQLFQIQIYLYSV